MAVVSDEKHDALYKRLRVAAVGNTMQFVLIWLTGSWLYTKIQNST